MSFPRGPIYDGYHQQDRRTQPNIDHRLPPQMMDGNMEQRRYEPVGQLPYNDPRMRGYPQPGARHPDPRFPAHPAHPTHPGYEKRFNPESKPNFNDRSNYGGVPIMHSRPYDEYGVTPGRQFPPMSSHHHDPYKPAVDGPLGPPPHRMTHQGMGIGDRMMEYPTSRALPRGAPSSMGPGLAGHFPDFPPSHLQSGLERGAAYGGHLELNYPEMGLNNLPPGESRGPPAPPNAIPAFHGHSHGESRGPAVGLPPSSTSGFQSHLHGVSDSSAIPRAALHNINPQVLANVPPVVDAITPPTLAVGSAISETLPIPSELSSAASDPGFMEIISRVKEQLQLLSLTFGRATDGSADSLIIEAPSREKATLAKNLLETHLKQQWKIKMAESRLQKIQTDLHSTQGEIMSGHMVEVMISPELVGLTIGKKGARIKQIEADTGVNNINVGDNGHIVIYGLDSGAVQRAREQLELKEEKASLSSQQLDWISNKANGNVVAELRTSAGLMLAKINYDTHCLDMIGTHQSVGMAQLLLSTQLEYIDKQIEIENSERTAREKLHAARKQLGMGGNWKNRNSSNTYTQNQSHPLNDKLAQPVHEAREFSLPPPPGLAAKNHNSIQQQLKPKSVDESLDALISSAELGKESAAAVSSKQKKQQFQQQQQNTGNKGQKNDKKSNRHEAFSFNDSSPSVDLFEISQASARMKVDHPQHMLEEHQKEPIQATKSKSRQQPDNKDKQKGKVNTRDNNDVHKESNSVSKKGGRTVLIESKDDAARTVLPPPPTLTVPENKQQEEDKKKQSKEKKEKDKKKIKKKDEEFVHSKEPMLTKINLPFQKSTILSSISHDGNPSTSVIVPIPPQRSSGPPKDFSLSVIPPSGPPAKELASASLQLSDPVDSSSIKNLDIKEEKAILEEDTNKKKQQRNSRTSEVPLSAEERGSAASKEATISKEINQSEFSVNTDNIDAKVDTNSNVSSKAQSPPAPSGVDKKSGESSTRRVNSSKAAIMDSLMTVRPEGEIEPVASTTSTVVHTSPGRTESSKRITNEDKVESGSVDKNVSTNHVSEQN